MKMVEVPNKLAMTASEVAPIVGVSADLLLEGAKRGEIPARRIRRRYFFNPDALRAYFSDPSGMSAPEQAKSSPQRFYPVRGLVTRRIERRRERAQ